MATLCLDAEFEGRARCEMHNWIGEDWALLFSNPEDFQPHGWTQDRWLQGLRQDLGSRAVRALAVKRHQGSFAPSWIDDLNCDRQLVRLREPSFVAADPISFATRALRGQLLTQKSRFVFIVDGALKRRGLLTYSDARHHLSTSELLASLDALRRQPSLNKAA